MRHVAWLMIAAFSVGLGGCDLLESEEQKQAEIDRREEEKAALELVNYRERMVKFVEGKLKLAESELPGFAKRVAEVRKDVDELTAISSRMMAEKDGSSAESPREERLLALMREPRVNALAVKYLATDFSRATVEFEVAVENTKAAQRRYDAALKEADTIYNNSIGEVAKWSKATAVQRETEIKRLAKELKKLEEERRMVLKDGERLTRNSIAGGERADRERSEKGLTLGNKVYDLDQQIDRKRRQIDYLRHPDNNRRFEEHAVYEAQRTQTRANDIRRRHLADVEKHFKPKQNLLEITSDYEKRTIGALTKMLSEKLAGLDADELALRKKISTIKNAQLALPVSDRPALDRIRKTLETN